MADRRNLGSPNVNELPQIREAVEVRESGRKFVNFARLDDNTWLVVVVTVP